ncbi:MAG: coniferyl aldehyde dehydrogenase [Lysobacteraceae bacterium]
MDSREPAQAPAYTPAALAATLSTLREAWRTQCPDFAQRRADLDRLAAAIKAKREAIVEAINADFGRRAAVETLAADVMVTLEEIKHVRKHLRSWMKPKRAPINLLFLPARGEIRFLPLGVVGIVAPWNYPFQLAIIPLVDAIAAGNHVMIKPSEFTPRTSALIRELCAEVFPADRVAVIEGDAAVGAAFTSLPFDHLLFTGSTAVGRKVMAAAAPNLVPVTLELGGKSPALIAPGYDIVHAAERIATGKLFNAGQTCVAPDYVLVPEAQREAFIAAFLAAVAKRLPTLAGNADLTCVINPRQSQRLREWLDDAKQRGVAIRQHAPDDGKTAPGEIIPPTVLIDPPDEARVMQEEIFGPLLPVKGYRTHDEALAYILGRDRPLAFYPFDHDRERLERTLDTVVAGSVCVNDTLIQFGQHELPIGGVGASGMGHYHGHQGFLTFSKAMPVMRQARLNGMFLFDQPYSGLMKRVLDVLTR